MTRLPAVSRLWRSVPRRASVPKSWASALAEPAALPEPVPLATTEFSGVSSDWVRLPVPEPLVEPLVPALPVRVSTDLVTAPVAAPVTLPLMTVLTGVRTGIGIRIGAGMFGITGIGAPPKMPPPPPRIWALAGVATAISAAAVVRRMVFMAKVPC